MTSSQRDAIGLYLKECISACRESTVISHMKEQAQEANRTEYKVSSECFNLLNYEATMVNLSDLEELCNNNPDGYASLRYSAPNRELIAKTHPLVLEGVELGEFEVHFPLDQSFDYLHGDFRVAFRVVSLQPARPDYPHPHVDREKLCWGRAFWAGRIAAMRRDLFSAFQMVLGILNTYNPESPYAKIESYLPAICDECFANGTDQSMIACRFCMNRYCRTCSMFACAMCSGNCCRDCSNKVYWRDSRSLIPEDRYAVVCSRCYIKFPFNFTSEGKRYRVFFASEQCRVVFTQGNPSTFKKFVKSKVDDRTPTFLDVDGVPVYNMGNIPIKDYFSYQARGMR